MGSSSLLNQRLSVKMDIGLCVENSKVVCDVPRKTEDCPGRDDDGKDSSGYGYTIDGLNRMGFVRN